MGGERGGAAEASTVLDGLEIERLGIAELGLSHREREVVALDAVADVEPIDVPRTR